MLKAIKEAFQTFIKWLVLIILTLGLGYVIFKVLSSKNPNKFDFIRKIFVSNPVSKDKKDAVESQGKKVDVILDRIKSSIKDSEEFLNG